MYLRAQSLDPFFSFCRLLNFNKGILLTHGISAMMTSCTFDILYMRTLYPDNTQLNNNNYHKQQHDGGTVDLEACLKDIKSWCVSNKLVLKDRKTEIDLLIYSKFS